MASRRIFALYVDFSYQFTLHQPSTFIEQLIAERRVGYYRQLRYIKKFASIEDKDRNIKAVMTACTKLLLKNSDPYWRPRVPRFDSRRCQIFCVTVGLERINEELLERKVAASV
jgi:hypothetical protein